jgi:hypothetical protein
MNMNWMKRKPLLLLLFVASLCFSLAGSAYAFQDVKKDPEKASIERLEKDKIVKGDGNGKFTPKQSMNVASAVTLIVNGMSLNIDNIRFIKEPKASDYFTKVPDNASYAKAFIIAQLNGLEIPKDIDPAAKATREQFSHWLFKAISKKGDYAFIDIYMQFKDEKSVNPAYMDSIQKLLIVKIATLDKNGNFRPKEAITRSEAAGMLDRARLFVKNTKPIEPVPQPTSPLTGVTLIAQKISDDVKRVTITAQAPHPGYGIEVSSIQYNGSQAVVNYRVIQPDPNLSYIQVITEVKAVAYIDAKYEPVLGSEESSPAAPVSTKHPILNPDGTSGGTGSSTGIVQNW